MVYNKLDCFVSVKIRNIHFDRYYENPMVFSNILGKYLNSVKLDYMSY